MPPDPLSLVCLCKLDIHVTPLLKILATGLSMLALWSWLSFAALVLSICVWFVAPDMVDLLWVSAEVKRGSVVPTRGEKYNLSQARRKQT